MQSHGTVGLRKPQAEGQAASRNDGITKASGDAIVFLDADDRIGAGYLAALARAASGRYRQGGPGTGQAPSAFLRR